MRRRCRRRRAERESINGTVSYPSDNSTADHWGERKVSDGLLVFGP